MITALHQHHAYWGYQFAFQPSSSFLLQNDFGRSQNYHGAYTMSTSFRSRNSVGLLLLFAVAASAAVLCMLVSVTTVPTNNHHRRLTETATPTDDTDQSAGYATTDDFYTPQTHGKALPNSPGIIVNMLRRAKDRVSESDVPFLLQLPHTSSDTIYNILTECYGLEGKKYLQPQELEIAKKENAVDRYYMSSHEKPTEMFTSFGKQFHFISTPHYQEGAGLFTFSHKGRIMLMLRHPAVIGEFVCCGCFQSSVVWTNHIGLTLFYASYSSIQPRACT